MNELCCVSREMLGQSTVWRDASMLSYEVGGCTPLIWLAAMWMARTKNPNFTGYRMPLAPEPPTALMMMASYWWMAPDPFPTAHYMVSGTDLATNGDIRRLTVDRGPPVYVEQCQGGTVYLFPRR